MLAAMFRGLPVIALNAWVSRETIDDTLRAHGFEGEIDHLGIDLDGMDYWIWRGLTAVNPRWVVAEYNPFFGSELALTVPYQADFSRKAVDDAGVRRFPWSYYGASLAALARLGREKGYRLVGCAPGSANAYFVRDDLAPGLPAVSPAEAFQYPDKEKYHRLMPRIASRPLEFFADRGLPLIEVFHPAV
jgi:hypothetical protein